jgi:hypothetical protein
MAVVTRKYLKERAQLKRHLRYITHRRGREAGRVTRVLFNAQGLTDRRSVYNLIDAARRGTVFYKFMINLDPAKEDSPFAAVLHPADHSPLRHVHGIFLLPRRLSKAAFRTLRQLAWTTATAQARLQRRARDRVLANPRNRSLPLHRARTRFQQQPQAVQTWPKHQLHGCGNDWILLRGDAPNLAAV